MVCTTIKPTKIKYSQLFHVDKCAKFIADYITYQQLENPLVLVSDYFSAAFDGRPTFLKSTKYEIGIAKNRDKYKCIRKKTFSRLYLCMRSPSHQFMMSHQVWQAPLQLKRRGGMRKNCQKLQYKVQTQLNLNTGINKKRCSIKTSTVLH